MSSFTSRIAGQFASSPGGGNCANARFFLWMALDGARSSLAFLDRAERERPGVVSPQARAETGALVRLIELMAERALREPAPARIEEFEDALA